MLRTALASLLLLVLPLLDGSRTSARTIATSAAGPCGESADACRYIAAPPPRIPPAALSGAGSLVEALQTTTGVKTPLRLPRHGDSTDTGTAPAASARCRAHQVDVLYLDHARTLLRARANVPVTYGTPPPSSLS